MRTEARLQMLVEARQRARFSPERMARWQRRQLRELLRWAWQRCAFYRELYRGHGLGEADLDHVSLGDLPLLDKDMVMDRFDAMVTDPLLRLRPIEAWLGRCRDPRQRYLDRFVVTHTSGTSGRKGVFVSDQQLWDRASVTVADRVPAPRRPTGRPLRRAFHLHESGHFAGITTATTTVTDPEHTLFVPLTDPPEQTARALAAFAPDILSGYATQISAVAEAAGRLGLRLSPTTLYLSGDSLTPVQRRTVKRWWPCRIVEFYSATESPFIGHRSDDQRRYTVIDDLQALEVLDERRQPVGHGERGEAIITNFFNKLQPLIRYKLGDIVVQSGRRPGSGFSTIESIAGKSSEALPATGPDGATIQLSSQLLNVLFVPGLKRCQFVSHDPGRFDLLYEANVDLGAPLGKEMDRILASVDAETTRYTLRRVERIPPDPQTGKFRPIARAKAEP